MKTKSTVPKRKRVKKTPKKPVSSAGKLKFRSPGETDWRVLFVPTDAEDSKVANLQRRVEEAKAQLQDCLLTSLQMPNLVALTGSGTSNGLAGGPSMWNLWDHCVNLEPDTDRVDLEKAENAEVIIERIGFDEDTDGENIEALLSRCEAYLVINDDAEVEDFAVECKRIILESCSDFLDSSGLDAHRDFLHRLSRRRVRDPRLRLFTTNYDLCFEVAASEIGLVVVDGFSFASPRRFSPTHFTYDIVRRPSSTGEIGEPLEGVFHLLKLHGSVNWSRHSDGGIIECESPDPEDACLIYPARGKYQQSYSQPHLELMSQFLTSIRQSDTCLFIAGFGFNDDHIAEPILTAIRSNPQLRLVIADFKAEDSINGVDGEYSRYWKKLSDLAAQSENIWFVNGAFGDFCKLIPDLRALTPGQQLEKAIKGIARS